MRKVKLILLIFCIILGWLLAAGPAFASPQVDIDSFEEWEEALLPPEQHIRPMTEAEGQDYLLDWQDNLQDGSPYPSSTTFLQPQLYVYGGGGEDPCTGYQYSDDAGLVMYWGAGDGSEPTGEYTAAWMYDYGKDPDLRNAVIQVTVWPPQMGPSGQVNAVSFGIVDIFGRTRSWWWNCGPGNPIPWNVATTITINTAIWGVNATVPAATGFMNTPGFNLAISKGFIVDENFQWIFGQQSVPPPGQPAFVGMWNYWHNLIVWPNFRPISPTKKAFYLKWSQPAEAFGEDPPKIYGWDEISDYNHLPIMADDWKCTDDRPITDFHWWGSFIGWDKLYPPPIMPKAFHLGVWTNAPASDPCDPSTYSHPDMLIWEHYCDNYVWNLAGYDYGAWKEIKDNPNITVLGTQEDFGGAGWPNEWWLRGGSTGIKFTFNGIPAPASSHVLVKFNLGVTNHLNGELGLDGLVDITINPGDPNPNKTYTVKDVLFDNVNPNNWIVGYNKPGGSYETRASMLVDKNYIQAGTLVVQVDRHVDVKDTLPAAPTSTSQPINMFTTPPTVPTGCYDNDDGHTVHINVNTTGPPGNVAANDEVSIWDVLDINETCFQFTQLLSQEHWFYQEPNDPGDDDPCSAVYWLSIAAIYDACDYTDPNFRYWGWKTRPHFFEDDAVHMLSIIDPCTGLTIPPTVARKCSAADPVKDVCDVSWDLAFQLTTLEEPNRAPWPNPMTWESEPNAVAPTVITMTATTANHDSGAEYYFDETTGNPGGNDSGWQDSSGYTDSGLDPNTTYTYQVKARDKSRNNETAPSTAKSATTPTPSAADYNADGIVNFLDFAYWADRWMSSGP